MMNPHDEWAEVDQLFSDVPDQPINSPSASRFNNIRSAAENAYVNARTYPYGRIPGNVSQHLSRISGNVPQYLVRGGQVAGALGAGYFANSALGNPIGGAIDAVTFGATNFRPDYPEYNTKAQWATGNNPTAIDSYNRMGGVGDNLYRQQLNDSMWAAEKAARLKQDLGVQALSSTERLKAELAARQAEQAYAQELALQTNKLQAEREIHSHQLAAAQANQLLNGYINMIQSANDRASSAAGTRF